LLTNQRKGEEENVTDGEIAKQATDRFWESYKVAKERLKDIPITTHPAGSKKPYSAGRKVRNSLVLQLAIEKALERALRQAITLARKDRCPGHPSTKR
jgi:hypothetical protein